MGVSMKLRGLGAAVLAGIVMIGCGSSTPSNALVVSITNATATAVTGGTNYTLTIHILNAGSTVEEVTAVGVTLATASVVLGTNQPGLPFAFDIGAHSSEDSRPLNITDTTAGNPIATIAQATVDFVDSNGATVEVVGKGTITLVNGTAPTTPTVPATSFDTGRYRVGIDIAPARYFSAAPLGCYLERESGLDNTSGEILGNDFVEFNAPQWIVDILPTDIGFETSGCGTWTQ